VIALRILVTGGTGVLGAATVPLLVARGHDVAAPRHSELDLFDRDAIGRALDGAAAVFHLATRIPTLDRIDDAGAWHDNDRLRSESLRLIVDAGLAAGVQTLVQPSIALFYPPGEADEDTALGEVAPSMRSGLVAEDETARFAAGGGRGVVLRLGLLDGAGTGHGEPNRVYGATLDADDAGEALVAALTLPSGIYNVTRDGERVSNARFKAAMGWQPRR
jgi:nucleoside-diphosphate-sugar epimerase